MESSYFAMAFEITLGIGMALLIIFIIAAIWGFFDN